MDSSKIIQGAEECSSSESGWTAYIALSEQEDDHFYSEEDESCSVHLQGCKKNAEEDVDSDDSMASDASSGPSDERHLYGYESKYAGIGKKHNQQEEMKKHHEKIKAEKDKSIATGK